MKEEEIFMPIKNFEGKYEVSNFGRIKTFVKSSRYKIGDFMNPSKTWVNNKKSYYLSITLKIELPQEYSAKSTFKVHRLVAQHFIPNPYNLKEVNHIDGDKTNNKSSNLEWITHRDNIKHSYRALNRKTYKGTEHWNYGKKFSEERKYLMSISKKGINHPKFKGWYIINGSKFASAPEAASKTGLNSRTIIRKCKSGKDKDFYFLPSKPTTNG